MDVLRAQGMTNEYLVPFEGMDEGRFLIMILSLQLSYSNNFLYHMLRTKIPLPKDYGHHECYIIFDLHFLAQLPSDSPDPFDVRSIASRLLRVLLVWIVAFRIVDDLVTSIESLSWVMEPSALPMDAGFLQAANDSGVVSMLNSVQTLPEIEVRLLGSSA